jgi:sterol desaturase/sphingolipid hydroxylase (fatty acid hydroxylase superfamily)
MKKLEKVAHRMYNNPVLELLSKSGPRMMATYHLLLSTILLYVGYLVNPDLKFKQAIAWFVGGFSLWTLAEYILHRYLFHFKSKTKWGKAFHFAMHGYHHDHPHDYDRLFMPPVPASLFLLVFFLLFKIFAGSMVWFFLPGFELGYLLYSYIHYTVHVQVKPKNFEKLWLHHSMHHYRFPNKAYGVSTRFWDKVFGTMPNELKSKS